MEQAIIQWGIGAILLYMLIKDLIIPAFMYLLKGNGKKTDSAQDIKLAVLETKMDAIMKNHLPHLEKRLDFIDAKLDKLLSK